MKTKEEMIAEYDHIIKDLEAQKYAIEQEISARLVDITKLKLLPFADGEKVKCEVPVGRSRCVRECVIEIDKKTGIVWVKPFNKDGELSGKRFYVDRFDGDYDKIFTK